MEQLNDSIKILILIKQIWKLMRKDLNNNSVTPPQGMLLGNLIHNGKMKLSDLSEKLSLSNSTVSGIVDRLEKQNLVKRIRSDEDRRVVYVDITPECKKGVQEDFKLMQDSIEKKIGLASDEELKEIFNGLNTLKRILEK